MEYEYAISVKKPVIAFLHGDPRKIAAEKTDPGNRDKLRSFRELRTENDSLKRALEHAKSEPPKGSEIFAFGDEEIQLHFSFDER